MDNTKEFILQSEKAWEIQNNRKYLEIEDLAFEEGFDAPILIADRCKKFKLIWLPRQDQLQGMVICWANTKFDESIGYIPIPEKMDYIYWSGLWVRMENFRQDNFEYTKTLDSMEQLWLAFVMKEKFNKVWNGEDWEKINA